MKNIKQQYIGYDQVISNVNDENLSNKIIERLAAIRNIYYDFITLLNLTEEDIILNERVLMHAILDYFTDITRLKEFHDIELINKDKIIAYEISWFLKRKPIQVLHPEREDLVYINEKFALTILIEHLTQNAIKNLQDFPVFKAYCDFILYYFKYRNCDAKIIELLISSFKAGNSLDSIKYN